MAISADPSTISPAGVYAAAVTPKRERSNFVDLSAAMEVIEFLNASPAAGISIYGTTGNFLHFDVEEREKLVSFAIKRSRKPVGVGISHSTLDVTVHLAEQAAASGASFALILPPYYFRYSEAQIEEFFLRLGEKAARFLPLYLYNIPFFTTELTRGSARRLLASGLYAGIKDSSGDPSYLESLTGLGKTLLVGNDTALCASRQTVASGVISGCAAAIPELICALDRSLGTPREAALAALLEEFIHWLNRFPTPVGVEEACRLRNLPLRPDATWLGGAPLEEFRSWFLNWLPGMLREAV
ncbi:MAG: dihydrodipicolinate synthase family protein [Acidobacteriota bacterium]